jgi:hypothetical protein
VRIAMIQTPSGWMNLADWDRYWSEILDDKPRTSIEQLLHLTSFENTSGC